MERVRRVLSNEPRIAYALLFGSATRSDRAARDVDIAIGLQPGTSLEVREIGALAADLEEAAGLPIDLVILDEAASPLAYRAFRDGVTLVERNHRAMADRKARAILDYLDFRPLEQIAIRGVLAAAARGR